MDRASRPSRQPYTQIHPVEGAINYPVQCHVLGRLDVVLHGKWQTLDAARGVLAGTRPQCVGPRRPTISLFDIEGIAPRAPHAASAVTTSGADGLTRSSNRGASGTIRLKSKAHQSFRPVGEHRPQGFPAARRRTRPGRRLSARYTLLLRELY
ncbi:hypothetical protein EVAR_18390_1 [Eumeta japonica]|uniref:Uncharacterized protein n=1 Tax=Eumeta variegata TaxID=151549 RepID=A0A4C1UUK1_EUMVA|nr:hypothetical protein EVAR_18390_1 [Eumeta japonica]